MFPDITIEDIFFLNKKYAKVKIGVSQWNSLYGR